MEDYNRALAIDEQFLKKNLKKKETRKSAFTEKVDFLSNLNKDDFLKRSSMMSLKNSSSSLSKSVVRPSRFSARNTGVNTFRLKGRQTVDNAQIPYLASTEQKKSFNKSFMVSEIIQSAKTDRNLCEGLLSETQRPSQIQSYFKEFNGDPESVGNQSFTPQFGEYIGSRIKECESQIHAQTKCKPAKEEILDIFDLKKSEESLTNLDQDDQEKEISKLEEAEGKENKKGASLRKIPTESSLYASSTDIIIESFDRPRKRHTSDGPPLLKRAVRLKKKKQYSNALEVFNEIIESTEPCEEAFFHRAFLNERMGQVLEAVDDYQDFLKTHPSNAIGFFNLGICFGKLKIYEKALESFNKVVYFCYLMWENNGFLRNKEGSGGEYRNLSF